MYLKQILIVGIAVALIGCEGGDREVSDFGTTNTPGTATISGNGLVGETLTSVLSDPDGIQQNTVAYQWNGDGTPIPGATSSSYTLTADEGREAVTVSIRYTDDRNITSTAVSNAIVARPLNVSPTLEVDVPSAGAIVGQALTAVLTDDNDFTVVNYQWIGSVTGPIAGATDVTFRLTPAEVGENISVSATYTDDDGYDEDLTSAAVGPVTSPPPEGAIVLTGEIEVGATLTATLFDGDGFAAVPSITYVWEDENGVELANVVTDQLENEFILQPAQLGLSVTVTATYTDAAMNAEMPSATTRDFIHTYVVEGEVTLAEAIGLAVDGDIIGLDSDIGADDYQDMAELEITTDNVTVRLVSGSTAVITGSTCIVYGSSTTGVVIDGLVFDDLSNPNTANCGEGEGSIRLQGSFNTFSNNQILGQIDTRPSHIGGSDELHYMTVGGNDNMVERNLFEGLPTSEAKEGAAISMFISRSSDADPVNQPNGSNERNIIQYNLFRNFLPDVVESDDPAEWDTDSNGFGVQVGRSSSRDGAGFGGHVVQYNRFDTVLTDRRVILVQGGGNTIHGNTIVNSWGNVALEHGYDNTVSSNIIISSGVDYEDEFGGITVGDNLDGGISFVPLGHTIVDNYVGNISSDSSDRAGLHIDSETLEPSDSSSEVIWTSGLDLTNVVARNTFINIRNAIQFEHDANENSVENCQNLDYVLDFDDNLVANQSSALSIFGTSAGAGRTAIRLDDYTVDHGCRLDDASEFTNTHIYSQAISDTDLLFRAGGSALVTGVNGNIFVDGTEDAALLTAPDANNLVEGTGADAGIGADIDALTFITEDMVGPGSTWTATP
ncbi:MAG: poly(beta-D-mannuronate) lyase [Chromatiales bacterium]|nr:MAG: poly(beta-D-mannuronate) lyase [Chromatiales bacterium]